MRVALVCPYDLQVPGGVQNHVGSLAAALRDLGDDVTTLSPGAPATADATHVAVGRSIGIPFNDSVAPIALWPGAARRTVATLRRLRPDVVHVHEPTVPWVSLAATLRSPAPVVGTFHAWSDDDRAYRLARPLLRRVVDHLAAKVAVSQAAAGYHAGALGLSTAAMRVIPNAVEVPRFAGATPMEELRTDGEEILLFVGRLERRKGLEQLIRAFPILKTQRPGLRLLVIGDGPERDACQSLLPARLRVDVDFLGRVGQGELPRFYATADVFVAPALGGESFGIVLLEAMAAGTPVVASDIPGYRSVVTDGVNGRLVPTADPRALAAAIGALLDNHALRAALAQQGRATAADHDWPVVAQRLRTLYLEVTGAAAPR